MSASTEGNDQGFVRFVWRLAIAAAIAASGFIHAQLYLDGYRFIHDIGVLFLVQASVSFAVAALLLVGSPAVLRIGAAGVALGALAGFAGSRTVGVFGFTERGFQPAPQSLISVLVEVAALVLLAPTLAQALRTWRDWRAERSFRRRSA